MYGLVSFHPNKEDKYNCRDHRPEHPLDYEVSENNAEKSCRKCTAGKFANHIQISEFFVEIRKMFFEFLRRLADRISMSPHFVFRRELSLVIDN